MLKMNRVSLLANIRSYLPSNLFKSTRFSTRSFQTTNHISAAHPGNNLNSVFHNSKTSGLKFKDVNKVVMWKLYGTFNRHNTLLTMVAVEEDPNFLQKNPDISYSESVLYYLQLPHHPKIHVSAGQLGFRKAQRSEYEAGYQVSARMFKLIEDQKLLNPSDKVELVLKNFGKGREAFLNALQGKEGSLLKDHIIRVSDATKLKFGGNRPKKLRRL